MPSRQAILNNRAINLFGKFLHDPNLWHLNRYCVATAISIGFFVAFMPCPGHMIIACLLAILLRANIPIAVAAVWINNPFTMVPMYYLAYRLGIFLLHIPHKKFHIEFTWHWLYYEFIHIAEPLLMGSCILGLLSGLIGNLCVRMWWRYAVVKAYRKRQKLRAAGHYIDEKAA